MISFSESEDLLLGPVIIYDTAIVLIQQDPQNNEFKWSFYNAFVDKKRPNVSRVNFPGIK